MSFLPDIIPYLQLQKDQREAKKYMYVITCHYDGNYHSSFKYPDAVTAVHEWDKCVDWGFANSYATYNLLEPNGKLHTKNFYRDGRVTGK